MNNFTKFLFSLILGILPFLGFSQDIFISPDGNDVTGDGSLAAPYATVEKAKAEVRALVAAEPTQPVNVYLRGGTYYQDASLVFLPEDSGTPTSPITYQAYQGEEVIISTARPLTDWRQEGSFWVADAPGVEKLRAFFKDDAILTLARTPNKGSFLQANGTQSASEFYKKPSDNIPASWAGSGADVHVFQQWKHLRGELVSVSGNLITTGNPDFRELGEYEHAFNYYLDDNIDMLDAPGEWYHDESSEKVYYYPEAEDDLDAFVGYAPLAFRVVEFLGNPAAGQFVDNLHFEGISFRHAHWGNQTNAQLTLTAYLGLSDAAVYCFGLTNSSFTNCEIAYTGGHGLWFYDGSKNNTVSTTEFHDLGGGGIYMKNEPGLGVRGKTYSGNLLVEGHTVYNSLFYNMNNVHNGAHGIWMGNVENMTISHCDISGTNGSGVNIGYSDNVSDVGARNIILEYNRIHDIVYDVTEDWGGVHMLGGMPGTVIRNNLIYNINGTRSRSYAIYHDNGNGFVTVKNNILANAGANLVFAKGGGHVYENNILVSNGVAAIKLSGLTESFRAEKNIIVSRNGRGMYSYGDARQRSSQLTLDKNVYWCSGCVDEYSLDFDGGLFDTWQGLGLDENSVAADPGLGNTANLDFSFSGAAPSEFGIEPIDISEIGLEGDAEWISKATQVEPKPIWEGQIREEKYLVDTSFYDGFENSLAGFRPDNADSRSSFALTQYVGENAPIVVVSTAEAKTGAQSLLLRDQKLPRFVFNPNTRYYPMYTKEGVGTLEFDVKLKEGAFLSLENRSRSENVVVRLTAGEMATAGGIDIGTEVPVNEWVHVKLDIPTSSDQTFFDVALEVGGETFAVQAPMEPNFQWHRALFLSQSNVYSEIYLDNISLSFLGDNTAARNDAYTVTETQTLTVAVPGVLENDDPAANLQATLVENVSNGTLALQADGSFTYEPNLGFTGTDRFTYEVAYSPTDKSTAEVAIKVLPRYVDPDITGSFTIPENSANGTEVGDTGLIPEDIELSDDFEDSDAAAWTVANGDFVEANGVFTSSDAELNTAYTGSTEWTNYVVEADLTPRIGGGGGKTMGIMARFNPENNSYYSYRLNSNGNIQVIKYVNDAFAGRLIQQSVGIPISINRTYHLKLKVQGNTLTGYLNGVNVFTTTDENAFSQGAPGFVTLRGGGDYDNFRVYTELPQVDTEVFSDDFEDGDTAGWSQDPSIFTEANGVFSVIQGNNGVATYEGYQGTDYRVSADVKLSFNNNAGNRTIGIAGRVVDESNYYVWRLHNGTRLQLAKIATDGNAFLYNEAFPLESDQFYRLALALEGSVIRGYLDGELVVELSDSTFAQGGAGVVALRGTAQVDNFTVSEVREQTITINGLADAGIDVDGDGNAPFAIDPATGILTVNDSDDLDVEAFPSEFIVVVDYNDGQTAFVEVALEDVNEFTPVIMPVEDVLILPGTTDSTQIVALEATDEDRTARLTDWAIVSGNADADGDGVTAFAVSASGELLVSDVDELKVGKTYTVAVTVSDGAFTSDPVAIAISLAKVKGLKLTSVCSEDPATERRWRVSNPNEFGVEVAWDLYGTGIKDTVTAAPGDSFFFTPARGGANTVKITWKDDKGKTKSKVKASGGATCSVLASRVSNERTKKVVLYPNPAVSTVSLRSLDNVLEGSAYKIYAPSGQLVGRGILRKTSGSRIDVSALPPGIYLLEVAGQRLRFMKE